MRNPLGWKQKQAMGIFFAKACMTQKELADAIGVHPATISSWYNEDTFFSVITAQKIAESAGITLQELITWGI